MNRRPAKIENIWPEVIAAVITKRGKTVDLTPINFAAVSTIYEQPTSVCIGLVNDGYGLETIMANKEFVLAYPDKKQLGDVLYCGTVSGRDADKIPQTTLSFGDSEKIKPPRLEGAVINAECRMVHSYNVGNFTVVIAHVLAVGYGSKEAQKIYSLGHGEYGTLGKGKTLQSGR